MKKILFKRTMSLLLSAALLLGNFPVTAFAQTGQTLCEHHPEHTECGYAEGEADCSFVCELCQQVPEESAEAEGEPAQTASEPEKTAGVDGASEPAATEPARIQETDPVCNGLADCPGVEHAEGCLKAKNEADIAAAETVAGLIDGLPSLEQIQAKPMAQQKADYEQVNAAYGAYCALTADQQALLPPAEAVFKPYFDYFNSLVSLTWSGSGTSTKPFLIYTEQELRSLAQQVNSGSTCSGVCFKLAGNIALTSDWVPIGTEAHPFCGTFDGNGMTISGMTITGSHSALFAYVGSGAVIRNVNLTEFSVTGETYVAGLVAHADAGTGSITIADCSVDGTLRDNDDSYPYGYLGGIVAYANAESGSITISGCVSRGSYRCDIYSGGILGYGKGSSRSLKLRYCTNRAGISVYNDGGDCGGVAGYLSSAEVTGCMNYGNVAGNAYSEEKGTTWLGGIAGDSYGTSYTGCGNYGEISTFFAGGITPAQYGGSEMNACLNIGDMEHSSDGYGSALIYNGSAQNSFYLAGTGSGIAGATSVSASDMAAGAAAHALREYFGQTIGVDPWPVPLTDTNRVYKVTVVGEVSGTYYVNQGKTAGLPELSECAAYYLEDSKFDPATPITRDYALAAKGFHNIVDGTCTNCGKTGSFCVDAGSCGESVGWVLYSDGRLVISGTGAMTDYSSARPAPWADYFASIRSVEVTYGVTTVGSYALKGMANIASFTLADTVTRIGDHAFNGVTALTSAQISDYVTDIGRYAFSGCTAMTDLSLGDRLKTIGDYAFSSCYGLERVHIPSNVTILGEGAFHLCRNLSDYWGGNGLTSIGAYAFADTAIPYIYINDSVATIGAYAFDGCEALKKVIFYGDAPAIADTAFSGVTADCLTPDYDSSWVGKIRKNYGGTLSWAIDKGELTSGMPWIIDYDGTLSITGTGQMYSFSYGSAPWENTKEHIRSAVIGDGVTSIGDYAFYGCSNLSSISIPDSVTQIGSSSGQCFRGTALTQIPVSRYVTKIDDQAFFGADHLMEINVASGNTSFSSQDGVLFNRYGTTLLCYPAGKTGAYTIPVNVSSIGTYAFGMCDNLTQITIPAGVTSIGNYAFGYCDALSQITFAGSAPTIGSYGFYSTKADVYIPAGDAGWTGSKMVNYGGTLTWHAGSGTCGTGVSWKLVYTRGKGELTIYGSGAMDDYTQDTLPWKDHVASINTLVVSDGVTHVGAYALCPGSSSTDDTSLTKVTLADSVTSVGDHAFYFCTSLTNLSLGNGIQTIGDYAFYCAGLTSITLPDSLRTIGERAFGACYSLKSLSLGSGLQSIGSYAFIYCTGLQTVDLGSITTLEEGIFSGCTGLTGLTIPASVTSIGKWALRNCTALQYVEFLGDAPATFNAAAFDGATCNAYYSSSKSGWTSSKLTNYGGTLTWGVISQRGTCGSKAQWFLDTAGNLYICGSGAMASYSETSPAPWYDHRANIKMVTFRGVTTVGSYAFADCAKLQAVIFDGNAPSFGTNAFSGTACEMWYPSTASGWTSGVRKNYGGTLTWRSTTNRGACGGNTRWALDSTGTLVILGTGEMTNYYSVSNLPWYSVTSSIKSAVIGGEVTNVGRDAFWNCEALETVTIGPSVTTVEEYAFNGCESLREVTLGENVTTIGTRAFSYCPALKAITIGNKVTDINSMAFAGCSALESVTFLGNAPGIAYNAFQDVVTTAYYPLTNTTWTSGKKSNYKGTITWVGVCTSHDPTVSAAKAPTCTETGLTEGSYCSVCDEVLVAQEVIPATGHFAMGPDHTQVPADSLQPSCTQSVVCTVCNTVVKEALGHRIKAMATVQKDPLTVTNASAVPFTLTGGTYYSANKGNSSTSQLRIDVQHACTLSLTYGVSSEQNYDKLIIYKNGTSVDSISGEVPSRSTSLSLASGDIVIISYQKDVSMSSGQDCGWVTLTYSQVSVEEMVDVPADTGTPDCTTPVVCEYCDAVVKEALGHRVILQLPPQEAPYTVTNSSATPFTLTDGVYYSNNKTANSTSSIQFQATDDCTLTFHYGVSSEDRYDKLSISLNNTEKVSISGQVSDQTLTLELAAGDRVTVRYSKDGSVNKNQDEGWVSVTYEAPPTEQIVPADTVEADCDGVSCDFCHVVVKEALGHSWDAGVESVPATETSEGVMLYTCVRCEETKTESIPIVEHSHQYVAVVTPPTCTAGGYTTHTCSCGDSYTDGETSATGHSYEAVVTAPTCEEDGYTTHTCADCGDSYTDTEVPAAGHSYESVVTQPTCTEAGYTTHTCSSCSDSYVDGETAALDHDMRDWSITREATCTEDGSKERTCKRECGHSETETIPAPGHSYESVVTQPTCTEAGFTTHTCSTCGDSYVDGEKAALGHSMGIWNTTLEPTCTQEGSKTRYCDRDCGYSETEVIPVSGHSYEAVITDPTCESGGYTTHTCTGCGDTYQDEKTAALGHDMGEWEVVKEANCTETGIRERHCKRGCGVGEPQEIPINNRHIFDGCVCTLCGVTGGVFKTGASWTFREGVLTVSGSGEIPHRTDEDQWSALRESITAVVIEEGVTQIGNDAFGYMDNLQSVTLPEGLTRIGSKAFFKCKSLTEAKLPESLTFIGDYAFTFTSLPTVRLGANVKSVGTCVFACCDDLHTIKVSEENQTYYAMNGVLFSKDITELVVYPGGKQDEAYWVPGSVTTIHNWAFGSNNSLTQVSIPEGIAKLNPYTFSNCTALARVELPEGLTQIDEKAFYGCEALRQIQLPESVTSIERDAFFSSGLTEIHLGKNVQSIHPSALAGCGHLSRILVDGENSTYCHIDGVLFSHDRKTLVTYPEGRLQTRYEVPEGTTAIADQAFWLNNVLEEVILPDSLISIGQYALVAYKLGSITIPAGVETIGACAFRSSAMDQIRFLGDCPDIGENAFASVTAVVYYPADNTSWSKDKLQNYGGTLTWKPYETSGDIGDDLTWSWDEATGTLTVSGSGAMEDYTSGGSNPAPWAPMGKDIKNLVIEDGITAIGDNAFRDCTGLETASLPQSLESIGQSAFPAAPVHTTIDQTVRQWSQVDVGSGNEGFPFWDGAKFRNDDPIVASGKYGENVYWELDEDGNLEFFGTGDMYSFGATASPLYDLPAKHMTIGEGITNIGECAFEVTSSDTLSKTLKSVTIASTVEEIGVQAFTNCQALKTVTFAGNAPEFAEDAFNYVTATAYYPGDNETWTEKVCQDYGGRITWICEADVAESITLSSDVASVFVGQEFSLTTEIFPAGSTVELIYETDDLVTVKRVMDKNRSRIALQAVESGMTTVKVTDRISGQTASISMELKDPVRITSPHRSDYRHTGDMYYVFTPTQTMQYMVSLESLNNYWSTNVSIDIREQTADEAVADSVLSYDLDTTRLTATLEAGKDYLIHILYYGSAPLADTVLRLEPVQTVAGINIAREEMTVWIDESLFWNWFTIPVEFLPDQAMAEVTWTSSDPDVLVIAEPAGVPCCLEARKPGTAVVTVSCGAYSDSVTVTVKYAPELTLGVPMENICDYGIGKVFKFTSAEDGIYIFSAESEADLYLYTDEHSPNNAEGSILKEMHAGETAYLVIYGENAKADQADYTVRVDKAGAASKVDIRFAFNGNYRILTVTPAFEPDNTLDPMVKLEVSDPELFTVINCNPYDAYLHVTESGSTVVTVTTEKGLTASRTVRWGTWGDNLSWLLDGTGTLTISGSGDMLHYLDGQDPGNPGTDSYPWHKYGDEITSIVVQEGLDSLSERAFHGLENLTDVTLPDSLDTIGDGAFSFCTALESLTVPENVSVVGKEIFYGSTALKEITFTGNAPELDPAAFGEVTIMSRYPADNDTWTEDVLENYGGQITWTGYCKGPHTEVTDAAKDPTCTETGLTAGSHCSVCKEVLTEQTVVPAKGHSHEAVVTEPTCTEGGFTTHTCSACGDSYVDSEVEALNHDMGEWETVTEATCTEDGRKVRTCNRGCGHSEEETIPVPGHSYEAVVTEPTCTEAGFTTHTCSACGDSYVDTEVAALGHNMSAWVIDKSATCTEEGTRIRTCIRNCGHTEEGTIPVIDHSYEAVVTEPTCLEKGFTTHTCSVCGDSYVDSETETLGHDMGDWTDTDQPGQQRRDCSRCDYFELQETMEGGTRITLEEDTFVDVDTLYADGIPYPVVKTENGIHVDVPEGTGYLVSYTWHIGDAEDIHTQYPVGMKVYQVEETDTGSTAREIPELENLLRYSGSSIRITGNKGIRMITSITNANKAALTGAGLAGFTLVEYGTALCWTSDLEGGKSLILGQEYTRSNYAYKKGVADPVFAYSGDLMQYTNVLVGFSLDQCRDDIAMRPYIILEDGDGNTVTLYGGTIHRSIGYIAWQNRTVFSPGNAAYDFIWEIIHHVYGDQYDEDYQGT